MNQRHKRRKKNDIPDMRRCGRMAVVNVNRRRIYLGPAGSEIAEERYRRFVAEWEASGRSPAFGWSKEITIQQMVDDYLKFCEVYYGTARNSELHRAAHVAKTLCSLYGSFAAKRFDIPQFKAVRQKLLDEGHSRPYINANMRRIIRMFKWLAGEGRLSPVVAQALAIVPRLKRGRTTAREPAPIMLIDPAIVDATLPYLGDVVADMVRFHRLTGCRPAEVCSVRPCDLDRSGTVWLYRPAKHKTQYLGRERIICVGPKAQDVLRPYLLRPAESFCFSPAESERHRRAAVHAARKTPLMCGNRPGTNRKRRRDIVRVFGERYDPRSYRHAIYYGCKKAGVEPWAPNRLRHLAATEIRKQFGLEAAQVVLGHARADVTQVYAERNTALAAHVALQVG